MVKSDHAAEPQVGTAYRWLARAARRHATMPEPGQKQGLASLSSGCAVM
jgi:hypothetical protein